MADASGRLRFGSLFAGIGGIDLGLERAGMDCAWQVEIDDHCRQILARRWPDIPQYRDVTAIDWTGVPDVDVLAGGFPCQPVSRAGRRRGESDDGWLWGPFAEAIRVLRPRYVLVENVTSLLVRGIDRVLGDLAACGYDAEWECLPAAAVGAPHIRDRLYLVAYPGRGRHGAPQQAVFPRRPSSQLHGGWTAEPDVGRVADGVPGRVDRIRALGNAVVPQVAEHIGRLILEADAAALAA